MIVQKNFLNKLKDFGLNTYESKLWTALLSRGVSTAGELSDIANVPRSRSYDVLESLEKKGFIVMKLGKPIKYLAVPPAEVIERVKKRVSEEASRHGELLESLRGSKILEELNTLHQQGSDRVEPTEMTAHVKGWSNLVDHLESMIKGATTSIDIITSETGLQGKAELIKRHAAKDKNLSMEDVDNAIKTVQIGKVDEEKSTEEKKRICFKNYFDNQRQTYFVVVEYYPDFIKIITVNKKKGKY